MYGLSTGTKNRSVVEESAMERWPLVEVPIFIYIVLKPKVTGVNMYVNSQHLYIKD